MLPTTTDQINKKIKNLCKVTKRPELLEFLEDDLKDDPEVVYRALKSGGLLEHASDRLKNNPHMVEISKWYSADEKDRDPSRSNAIKVVEMSGQCLEILCEEFKNDPVVVYEAVYYGGGGLRFASEELRGDRDLARISVFYNGYSLACLSEELKNDLDLVKSIMVYNEDALKYASKNVKKLLKNNK